MFPVTGAKRYDVHQASTDMREPDYLIDRPGFDAAIDDKHDDASSPLVCDRAGFVNVVDQQAGIHIDCTCRYGLHAVKPIVFG